MLREIVYIDEDLCDGCGLCVPSCHEGAIRVIDGKARLVAEAACDGLGACLGHCPQDAIRIERREAQAFDESVVAELLSREEPGQPAPASVQPRANGCPGSRLHVLGSPPRAEPALPASEAASALAHWPVKLRLMPAEAPALWQARLVIAADCVPVACPDFQQQFVVGRAVLTGCPKFDELSEYVQKLAHVIRTQQLQEIVVARMEVPCCGGLLAAVERARELAGIDVPVRDVVIGLRGKVLADSTLPAVLLN